METQSEWLLSHPKMLLSDHPLPDRPENMAFSEKAQESACLSGPSYAGLDEKDCSLENSPQIPVWFRFAKQSFQWRWQRERTLLPLGIQELTLTLSTHPETLLRTAVLSSGWHWRLPGEGVKSPHTSLLPPQPSTHAYMHTNRHTHMCAHTHAHRFGLTLSRVFENSHI